jgi:hypothetical protein
MSKLRRAARDQCCVRCGIDDKTVVLCHYTGVRRGDYGGGFGRKVDDIFGAHLCATCHRYFDTESRSKDKRWEHSEEFQHMVLLTIRRLLAQGIIA